MTPPPLPFEKRIRAAGLTVRVAQASFDIWWLYASEDTRPQYLPGMDEFPDFFRFDQEAHLRCLIIGLWTLFDGRADTVTLQSLVDERAPMSGVSAIQAKLDQLQPLANKVKALRHKLFAHRDHAVEYNDAFKMAGLRPDDLRNLLFGSLTILNELAALHGLSKVETGTLVIPHTERLLKKIQPE